MLVHLQPVGDRGMYYLNVVGGGVDPGFGQGRPGGRPDQGLPGGGGHPDQGLPGMGGRPDQGLPGGGGVDPGYGQGTPRPGIPSNELPDTPPPQVAQGMTLVLVREGQSGKWHYATIAPGSPPPKPLPNPPEHVGGRPPGSGGGEHPSGQPVPPTAQPQRR